MSDDIVGTFSDPTQAARFRDLIARLVEDKFNELAETRMTGLLLDIVQSGASFPSSLTISTGGSWARSVDNPAQLSYAIIRVDDKWGGGIINAQINPDLIPLYRSAAYFDSKNPSGSGVMVDSNGRYVNVAVVSGVSTVTLDSYPSQPGNGTVPPQVAPRVAVVGRAGSWRVTELIRGMLANMTTEIPVGTIQMFAGSTIPNKWLGCWGNAYDPALYPVLFSIITNMYGGTLTAPLLPNFVGRVAVGPYIGDARFDTIGKTGGEYDHTLTTDEIVNHQHLPGTLKAPIGASNGDANSLSYIATTPDSNNLAVTAYTIFGSGTPSSASRSFNHHIAIVGESGLVSSNNRAQPSHAFGIVQPYTVVNYMIKAV